MSQSKLFEFKATIEGRDEPIVLLFKPYGNAPGRISRHNMGFIERAVWEYLEWGLVQPQNWPEESDKPGHLIFDEMRQSEITDCYNSWQAASMEEDDDEVEKPGGAS